MTGEIQRQAPETPADEPTLDEPTLVVVLTAAARRAPDTVVAAMCAVGILGFVVVLVLLRSWWRLGLLFGAVAAFGAWAIADREIGTRPDPAAAMRALKSAAAVLGLAASFVFFLSMLAFALGTWIS